MPKRTRIRTINGGPQGDDAKLVIIMPTVGEMREQGKLTKDMDRTSDEAEWAAREYLAKHVQSWNWVDDDGKPMIMPYGNPDVFGDLTNDEITFVGEALRGQAPEVTAEVKK